MGQCTAREIPSKEAHSPFGSLLKADLCFIIHVRKLGIHVIYTAKITKRIDIDITPPHFFLQILAFCAIFTTFAPRAFAFCGFSAMNRSCRPIKKCAPEPAPVRTIFAISTTYLQIKLRLYLVSICYLPGGDAAPATDLEAVAHTYAEHRLKLNALGGVVAIFVGYLHTVVVLERSRQSDLQALEELV